MRVFRSLCAVYSLRPFPCTCEALVDARCRGLATLVVVKCILLRLFAMLKGPCMVLLPILVILYLSIPLLLVRQTDCELRDVARLSGETVDKFMLARFLILRGGSSPRLNFTAPAPSSCSLCSTTTVWSSSSLSTMTDRERPYLTISLSLSKSGIMFFSSVDKLGSIWKPSMILWLDWPNSDYSFKGVAASVAY